MARYIDADVLKQFLHEDDFGTPDERWKPESEFAQMIDRQPTADVAEVKRGYWKEPMEELKIFKGRYLICSQCNVMLPIITELAAYYYCPNCGAKMDGKALKERKNP